MSRKLFFLFLVLLLAGLITSSNPATALSSPASSISPLLPVFSSPTWGLSVYETNFDSLALGLTQPFPGAPGQDGWFSELAKSPAYGEIQDAIAQSGQALHEFTTTSIPGQPQTIDKRFISPPNLSIHPLITLQVDFYAHTSDLKAENVYEGTLKLLGGPHPGFEILGFTLFSGGFDNPKGAAGVSLSLSYFNGATNNDPVPLIVGQHLAWDTWHSVTLVADQTADYYVSLTVNEETEDLSAYALPRSEVSPGVWERGQLMEEILAQVIPNNENGGETDDDVYWDNLSIIIQGGYQVYMPVIIR